MKATFHVFPSKINNTVFQGLEVRDYIAIQAMTGICANPDFSQREFDEIADIAYKQADEMIKRSNYEPEKKD